MAQVVLGVDGGGTKTTCVVLDEAGHELGRGTGGPANHHNVGLERTTLSVKEAIEGALAAAKLSLDAVGAICLGMAGADLPEDIALLEAIARRIAGVPHIRVCNDAVAALVGGIGQPLGVVVIAGTGSIAYGINARGEERRAGGWGYLLGDEGSAYHIGLSALRAVVRAYDGRTQATSLGEALCARLELERLEKLIELLYRTNYGVEEIAALAPVVTEAAHTGDQVARDILAQAGRELGLAATAVIHALGMEKDEFDVVLVGGVFQAGELLVEPLRQVIARLAPHASFIPPRHDPATGAALMARQVLWLA